MTKFNRFCKTKSNIYFCYSKIPYIFMKLIDNKLVRYLLLSILLLFSYKGISQVNLQPQIKVLKDWKQSDIKLHNEIMHILSIDEAKRTKTQNDFYEKWQSESNEINPFPWNIQEACGWYCGASYKTRLSSFLPPAGKNKYGEDEILDWDLRTAWVEGAKDYGIGEFIEFTFKYEAPRANKCIIYNGYMKDYATWKKNSRVKTLEMYENNKLVAILHLEDIFGEQVFDLLYPIGRRKDKKDATIKFVITEVYKGDIYKDTAISEFFFDGLDVHCLAKGTLISISKGFKTIENIKKNEEVVSFNREKQTFEVKKVVKVHVTEHSELLKLTFENGKSIITTKNHTFLTKNNWKSFNPSDKDIQKYNIGEEFLLYDKEKISMSRLVLIEELSEKMQTYTLELENDNGFIANGFIVGQE